MEHREVSVAVCGVVVGVMIAAATLTSLGSGFTASGTGSPVTRDPSIVQGILRQRSLPVSRRTVQRVRTSQTVGGAIGTTTTNTSNATACEAVQGAMANLGGTYLDTILPVTPDVPDASKNGKVRTLLKVQMDLLVSRACNGNLSGADMHQAASARMNNQCWQWFASPTRYTACLGAEDAGNPYP